MRVAIAFVFLLLNAAAATGQPRNPLYGEPPDFLGTWNNIELQRNMVVRIEIRRDYSRTGGVHVTVFGLRNGELCRFGEYKGKLFAAKYPKEREQDNSAILVRVDQDFVQGHVLLRFNGRGEIVSHALLNFTEQGPIYSVERFAASYRRYYGGQNEESYPPQQDRPYYRGY
jgi:hypothetical protein